MYYGIKMDTRGYPCFTVLYNMFYQYNAERNRYIKIVPLAYVEGEEILQQL